MSISETLREKFRFEPTSCQERVFLKIDQFIAANEGDECFVLKGYAGTGKTTIIAALVKTLAQFNLKSVLLAPTGRAAKVMSGYSNKKAFTIHKKIYRKKDAITPDMIFALAPNMAEDTIFIVDEASMISDESSDFSKFSLLHDLISYVYNGKNCKLMFVGDTAQLPPVGTEKSPALDNAYLADHFAMTIFGEELQEVVRQEKESGILANATKIRRQLQMKKAGFPKFVISGFKDIYQMTGERLPEGLHYAYDKYGMENTLVICRSNKNANTYNQQIRNRILYREEELTGGDYIMVVRNNYFWLKDENAANNFIANGDIAKIKRVRNIHEMYGFRFADAVIEFVDNEQSEPLSCKLMLDTLYLDSPSLTSADQKRFFEAVMTDYSHITNKSMRFLELKTNPYYNALQVKFAFATTCHKAQGGQWDAVFIDQGYLTEEMVNTDFLRWLYTAITRAVKEVFLVNFSTEFFHAKSLQ
ncbi:AAA family ATPase [Pedobacter sp. HMF7647]|uniref:AAA family ATPase n=1 Tax=Hufsiella arboris TaxID=2695275 RepID=A0A7K1Y7S1_9SPHI|nr:AAA family ATPase [Hufsiella arboris]MXV50617.1 AAA family ATPase [Hufsiella arboris]